MNPCPEDHVEPHDVKMETLYNRRHGARRRRFEVDDAVYVKDYRGQKSIWTLGFVVHHTGNATYTVRCGDLLWNRHVNQLRPRSSTSTVNQLLDVFDLPLFDSRADTDDSTPEDAMDLPTPPLRRSSRQRRAPDRLNVNPAKKTYS
ncbi:hypothetical protein Y032_0033g2693 [Ancylostoma ceylanicum]|uniref:Uncharacterized protein n=1 Tax=Ancylostoma ceylanicum TaxID=53326 RepID=A0A016UNK0_9BILA|nr:hypothetical protein Y032_0033g2693 [Ancylostoma ceylanicum]